MSGTLRPYLVIAGATAAGKSEIALEVAERLGGEIVLGDSRQVYRGLDIGTAKPTAAERARVPHHLVDIVEVGTPFSAGDFAREARRAIADIQSRERDAIVVGGTGFYLAALAGSLDDLPPIAAAARGRVSEIPAERRHAALAAADPALAARIPPGDRQRVERGLAFFFATGERLSDWQRGGAAPLAHVAVRIVRPREEIAERIEGRLDRMLELGLEDEARRFYDAGLGSDAPGLDGIGYREWWPYFEGEIDEDEVRRRILAATRRYAKRQSTWFRRQGPYRRVPAVDGAEGVVAVWHEERAAAGAAGARVRG